MPFVITKPHRQMDAPRPRRSPYPIQGWRNQIALAFALPPSQPDPEALATATAIRQLKADNVDAIATQKTRFLMEAAPVRDVAHALTAEAERCVRTALSLSLASMQRRHGPPPGRCAVLALGKMGGRELSFGSDLDVILVFERDQEDYSILAAAYFEEVARGLVGALSCPAALGALYEIDMRLRPHGGDGVLAVELGAFASYYLETCWTWELQALSRARVVAGDERVGRQIMQAQRAAFDHRLGLSASQLLDEVREMRDLLDEEHPAAGPWDVKRAVGGLVDIEFIAQGLQLATGHGSSPAPRTKTCEASTPRALEALSARGALAAEDAHILTESWSLQFLIQQYQRALNVPPQALTDQPRAVLNALLDAAKADTPGQLNKQRAALQRATRRLFNRLIRGSAPARLAA